MKRILIVALTILPMFIFSQNSPQELIEKFFVTYKKDKEKAVRDLYATNVWSDTNKEIVENGVKVVNGLNAASVGNYYGYELIKAEKITNAYEEHFYLLKYDRQPIKFIFKLYKPDQKWRLHVFEISPDIKEKTQ